MYNKNIFSSLLLYIEDDNGHDDDNVVTTWPHNDDEFKHWQRRSDDAIAQQQRYDDTLPMRPHDTTRDNNVQQWTLYHSRHDCATTQRTTPQHDDHTRQDETNLLRDTTMRQPTMPR